MNKIRIVIKDNVLNIMIIMLCLCSVPICAEIKGSGSTDLVQLAKVPDSSKTLMGQIKKDLEKHGYQSAKEDINLSVKELAEIKELESSDLKQREVAATKIRKKRELIINQLIQYASIDVKPLPKPTPESMDRYPWHDSKHLAILLLEDFRAIEAIPVLIENLEYINPRSIFGGIGYMYPSVDALVKIGMPAIDPVIEKLGTYDQDCLGRQNCVLVIKEVLGVKLGRYKLRLAIEENKNEKVKKNLQAVLPKFKTLQEKLDAERARGDKEKQKQK